MAILLCDYSVAHSGSQVDHSLKVRSKKAQVLQIGVSPGIWYSAQSRFDIRLCSSLCTMEDGNWSHIQVFSSDITSQAVSLTIKYKNFIYILIYFKFSLIETNPWWATWLQ